MKCKLITQKPKSKDYGYGCINVLNNGDALFMDSSGEIILKEMKRAYLLSICVPGMLLAGFEPAGVDKHMREKFVYQEWYLVTEGKP